MAGRTTNGKTNNKTQQEMTPFQKEQYEIIQKINEFKLAAEASVVSIIYKKPDMITEINLKIEDFTNNCWRVYFAICFRIWRI